MNQPFGFVRYYTDRLSIELISARGELSYLVVVAVVVYIKCVPCIFRAICVVRVVHVECSKASSSSLLSTLLLCACVLPHNESATCRQRAAPDGYCAVVVVVFVIRFAHARARKLLCTKHTHTARCRVRARSVQRTRAHATSGLDLLFYQFCCLAYASTANTVARCVVLSKVSKSPGLRAQMKTNRQTHTHACIYICYGT